MKLYPDNIGPDNLDLKLVQEVPLICDIYREWSGNNITTGLYFKEWMFIIGPKLIIVTYHITSYSGDIPSGWGQAVIAIYIALATKDNIEAAVAQGAAHTGLNDADLYTISQSGPELWGLPGFYKQSDALVSGETGNLNPLWFTYPSPPKNNFFNSIYVRPHTKEELQAAGMWPENN
jgi:hypothetical protein